ncbi:MAG TPA: tetratricopeptide repeat protein [Terracidiphilus sp.]|nr:tetratricopeptide repeat protein [Terracidiphilus sp.]
MPRFDKSRYLLALALFAIFAATTPAQTQAPVPPTTQPAAPANPASSAATTQPSAVPSSAAPASATPPGPPPTPEELADSLYVRKRYQAAIAAYSSIAHPSPEVWNKMGIAYQLMFNTNDAIRCYKASLKLDPRNAQVLNNLATVYDSLKQYKDAERYYRKALKIDPKSALTLRNFGSNLLTQHKYKKGWQAYREALAIDPQIFQPHSGGVTIQNTASAQERGAMHYYMAKGCVSSGNSECAIQNLRLAINEGYTNPKKIATDGSFASLQELPAFQEMIAAQSSPQ